MQKSWPPTRKLNHLTGKFGDKKQIEKLLPLERDKIVNQLNRLQAETRVWDEAFNEVRELEIKEQQEEARRVKREAAKADPELARLAKRNEELAIERSRIQRLIAITQTEFGSTSERLKTLEDRADSLRQNIEQGITPAIGMLLLEQRQSLNKPGQSQTRIEELADELQKSQGEKLGLEDELQQVISVESFVEDLSPQASLHKLDESEFKDFARELASTKRSYLDDLVADYRDYNELLVKLSNEYTKLGRSIQTTKAYVDKNALWIRSSQPIHSSDLAKSAQGAKGVSYFQRLGKTGERRDRPHPLANRSNLDRRSCFVWHLFGQSPPEGARA